MIQTTIADYVTSLLEFDESKVLIGRSNISQEIFSNNYIVIDKLAPSQNIANGYEFEGTNESMKYNAVMSGTFTLEFYGDNGYENVYKFINLHRSQLSKDLQKQYGMTIFNPTGLNDLKQVVGNKYYDRYEVEIVVQFNESLTIGVLKIDKIPVSQTDDLGNTNNYLVE
jgi:hypothetical protein